MSAVEVNFDGLVGPTHNYAGLSQGNLASARNKDSIAYPREAALQGLAKMNRLLALGVPQGLLAPHERPFIPVLRSLGFTGGDAAIWEHAWREAPDLARNAMAASAMWAANAATVSASADCADGRVHFSTANLITMPHRALEAAATTRMLERVFPDPSHFSVHAALPAHRLFADEGAANHMRMAAGPGAPGVEIFVYGPAEGAGFPVRQTRAASEAIARRHGIAAPIFAEQAQAAIDAGAFHNDVVAVAHENVLLFHEHSFSDKQSLLRAIAQAAEGLFEPVFIEIAEANLPLADAVSSYLFNSQIVSTGADRMTLILPEEAREDARSRAVIERIAQSNGPIGGFEYFDLRQSMRNGGGPACLRLRVDLTEVEYAAATPGFMLTPALVETLEDWVRRHYRKTLAPADLADPLLITETRAALDELTRVLPLGSDFYDFQRR